MPCPAPPWACSGGLEILDGRRTHPRPKCSRPGGYPTIRGVAGEILSLKVSLNITERGGPAFNGGLYATLIHETSFSVLLNRPGRRTGDVLGYGDSGLSVTFADAAGSRDVHRYRFELSGSHDAPVPGGLTGTWATDGRAVDPADVAEDDFRTATLASFQGLNPNGPWTLFVADLEPGDRATLQSWGLLMTVPEPAGAALAFAGFGATFGWWQCRRMTR